MHELPYNQDINYHQPIVYFDDLSANFFTIFSIFWLSFSELK